MYKESEQKKKEAVQLMLWNPAVFAVSVPIKAFQLWTSSEWTSAGNLKSKVLGVFRGFALLLALMALFNKRLDGLFKSLAVAAIGYITLFTAVSSYPEYRYAFWAYPMYYLLIAVSLNALAARVRLVKSEASSGSEP